MPTPSASRTGKVPVYATGGLAVRATDPSLLRTLGASVRQGAFLNGATEKFPVTVLGFQAAQSLGVSVLRQPVRVLIGGRWFAVAGILNPLPFAPELDRSVLVGFPVAARLLGYDGHPSHIYVRTDAARTTQVAALLGRSADPETPGIVAVSQPSSALAARVAVVSAGTTLFLGLGIVALLVGGIGIANVMVIAVLERRTEIGLRRALGGAAGLLLGAAVTAATAKARHWGILIPPEALWGGPGLAIVIGSAAGLYPAARAARMSPTEALRSS